MNRLVIGATILIFCARSGDAQWDQPDFIPFAQSADTVFRIMEYRGWRSDACAAREDSVDTLREFVPDAYSQIRIVTYACGTLLGMSASSTRCLFFNDKLFSMEVAFSDDDSLAFSRLVLDLWQRLHSALGAPVLGDDVVAAESDFGPCHAWGWWVDREHTIMLNWARPSARWCTVAITHVPLEDRVRELKRPTFENRQVDSASFRDIRTFLPP